ncbi:MAG: hypothetical protein MUO77_11205 [Anaerolineales bacterium]|nr:hypothetical protein [Anaerolineales bacterium]
MLKFFKKLSWLVKNYDADMTRMGRRIAAAENVIRERTEVHADIHMKSPAQVIMIGQYRGKDFVNIYDVGQGDFETLLRHLKEVNRYATPGRFDMPWPMIKTVIDKELR